MDEVLSPKDVAGALGVSEAVAAKMMRDGEIPSWEVNSRQVRTTRDLLVATVERRAKKQEHKVGFPKE